MSLFELQAALRQITDKAREFGAGPLFNQILPLLMSPTLEDQERHLPDVRQVPGEAGEGYTGGGGGAGLRGWGVVGPYRQITA